MKLEITDVEVTAYQNFVDSIRDKETFRKYNSYLKLFLDLIPNEMYKQYLRYEPQSREIQDLASAFTEIDGKKCHIDCKEKWEKEWKKIKRIED